MHRHILNRDMGNDSSESDTELNGYILFLCVVVFRTCNYSRSIESIEHIFTLSQKTAASVSRNFPSDWALYSPLSQLMTKNIALAPGVRDRGGAAGRKNRVKVPCLHTPVISTAERKYKQNATREKKKSCPVQLNPF